MILNELKIEGRSIAGAETNIRLPNLKIMFDLGICNKYSVLIPNLFITHCHPDHFCGFVNYIFQRKLHNLSAPTIFAPENMVEPMKLISHTVSSLHDSVYPANYEIIYPDNRFKISPNLFIEAVNAVHGVEAYGYLLFTKKFEDQSFFAYTGDTTIDIFEHNPRLYESRILVVEATFLGEKKYIKNALEHKHIHLNQLFERADLFKNDYILVSHNSSRYTREEINNEIAKAPSSIRNKIRIF